MQGRLEVEATGRLGTGVEGERRQDAPRVGGGIVVLDTFRARNDERAPGFPDAWGPDVFRSVEVPSASYVTVQALSLEDPDSVVCLGGDSGLHACTLRSPGGSVRSYFSSGPAWVGVDGHNGAFGRARLQVDVDAAADRDAACADAPLVVPGEARRDVTSGHERMASCRARRRS